MTDIASLIAQRTALDASILRASFDEFARWAWPRLSGGHAFPDNTATRALIAALQAVADGRIWRLLVAISPGIGKSTLLAAYAAWRRARRSDWRSMHAMHASTDANRESIRVRRLVQSADYQRLFPVTLAPDEQTVAAWSTTSGGRYYALGTDTAITSKRVLELVVDDPMTAGDRHSKAARDDVWTWLDESAKSRLDGDRAPIIIVAQRLDKDDIHARCLASGEPWAMLEPAAERDGRGIELRDHAGELVWSDDREPGELIAPQMLTLEKLNGLSKSVRTVQYQQRPDEDSGGGTIARTAWRFHAPAGANPNADRPKGCTPASDSPTVITPTRFDAIVISVDPTFGGTKTSNDFCSVTVWGSVVAQAHDRPLTARTRHVDYQAQPGRYLLDRWHERAKQLEQRAEVKRLRARYPGATILIELAAGGAGMVEELEAEGVKNIEGVTVGSQTGGKAARLDNVSPTIEQGFAFLPIGMADLQGFVDELAGMTTHDDDMDSTSQAIHWLNTHQGDGGASVREKWALLSGDDRGGPRPPPPPDPAVLAQEQAARRSAFEARMAHAAALDARARAGARLTPIQRVRVREFRRRKDAS